MRPFFSNSSIAVKQIEIVMTSARLLLASSSAFMLASCSWFNHSSQGNYDTQPASGGYDTSNAYGNPAGSNSTPYQQTPPPGNATYGKAAYEESSAAPVTEAPSAPESSHTAGASKTPGATKPSTPKSTAATSPKPSTAPEKVAAGGTVHVVGKGDTLWGISKKYHVSVDALKKANGLTKDTVVLGAKLQIPAH